MVKLPVAVFFLLIQYSISSSILTFELNSESQYQVFNVNYDQTFRIKILGNPTTGYEWILKTDLLLLNNSTSLLLVDEDNKGEYVPNSTEINGEKQLVGSGGYFYFTFRSLKSSKINTLEFIYQRSWESAPIESFNLTVNIEPQFLENQDFYPTNIQRSNLISLKLVFNIIFLFVLVINFE